MLTLKQLVKWLDERDALQLSHDIHLPTIPDELGTKKVRSPSISMNDIISKINYNKLLDSIDIHKFDLESQWRIFEEIPEDIKEELLSIFSTNDARNLSVDNSVHTINTIAHWDIAAWYQSIHNHGLDFGIYIREDSILRYMRKLAIQYRILGYTAPVINSTDFNHHLNKLAFSALSLIMLHEQFHYSIECLSIRFHAITKKSIYLPYKHDIYQPNYATHNCLEEALANANIWHKIGDQPYRELLGLEFIHTIRKQLEFEFPFDPPGYREASNFISSRKEFDEGQRTLYSQILENTLTPKNKIDDLIPATSINSQLFKITSHVFTIVSPGKNSLFPGDILPKRTASTDTLEWAFAQIGYKQVKSGNGSHRKYKKPLWPTITLTYTRENISPGVVMEAMSRIGLTIEDLPEFIKNPKSLPIKPCLTGN